MATEPRIIPATLSFLAIYNPTLGTTDETFQEQVVYWYSKASRAKKNHGSETEGFKRKLQKEENDKLKQIGLAQGMIGFAKSFANGQAVDCVDTERSRIVMHELEKDWWILASIDLTRLSTTSQATTKQASGETASSPPAYEYSSREVSPAPLLLQNIVDGHRIFLLHNGSSLSSLCRRLPRPKFCALLERFWNRFALNWDVLLHGNPSCEIFGGLKLAAGGELGIGVGEEEWGSGERDVLEDYARRTDGLVDVTVSRFGEPSQAQTAAAKKTFFEGKKELEQSNEIWMGAGSHAQVGDGLVFSGVGAVARSSTRDISHWVQELYAYGEHAYGVRDHPSNDRRKRKRKQPSEPSNGSIGQGNKTGSKPPSRPISPRVAAPPGIPPPIISAVEKSLERATSSHDVKKLDDRTKQSRTSSSADTTEGWTSYFKLGYGSSWGPSAAATSPFKREDSLPITERTDPEVDSVMRQVEPEPDIDPEVKLDQRLKAQVRLEDNGHFLIGLKGELTEDDELGDDNDEEDGWNQRTMLRTLHVEVLKKEAGDSSVTPSIPHTPSTLLDRPKLSRLRVIIYVHRPFIYTFLFDPHTESLSLPAFYRNLHTFFAPLHRPLSASTSPARVAVRIAAASQPYTTSPIPPSTSSLKTSGGDSGQQPIFDLVYDPRNYSVHASIPNIPMPGSLAAEGLCLAPGGSTMPEGWSRTEALNVHSAILEVIHSTRLKPGVVGEGGERELERSVKTGRGWWVVWMRLDDEAHLQQKKEKKENDVVPPPLSGGSQIETDYFGNAGGGSRRSSDEETARATANREEEEVAILRDSREAILVRRARDAQPPGKIKARATSGLWGLGLTGGGGGGESRGKDAGSGWGPAKLAEGVGVDTRRYVEGLLSLNR